MTACRILAVNPGSTSTKVALFDGETPIFNETISHSKEELCVYQTVQDQLPMRRQVVLDCLEKHHVALETVDVFVGRGGGLLPTEGGVYLADELLTAHAARGMRGEHPAQLASQICRDFSLRYGKRAYIVNPPDTDEFDDIARITGVKGYYRESHVHALNQKEIALRFCKARGLTYGQVNLIVCHLGGGISVTSHRRGRMVDSNDIMKGSGPMTPTRAGDMPYLHIVDMAFSGQYTKESLTAKLNKDAGLLGHFGTEDAREILSRIEEGDAQAKLVFDAMLYQVAKYIGAMAVALKGEYEAVILTGGLSRSVYITDKIGNTPGGWGISSSWQGNLRWKPLPPPPSGRSREWNRSNTIPAGLFLQAWKKRVDKQKNCVYHIYTILFCFGKERGGMYALQVEGLTKHYPGFTLRDVSFSLEPGYIMGFIGRNGAGKTTTIKSILNIIHRDAGHVSVFGQDALEQEKAVKGQVGLVLGGVNYYPKKKLKTIAQVTSRFYENWDREAFCQLLEQFELDENKTVSQLSSGMRVKFAIALALAHRPKLLILDEPTSGLDPVSRDEILEILQRLVESGERSILFSTHITSDLEKCADYITYIRKGEIVFSLDRETLEDRYGSSPGGSTRLPRRWSKPLLEQRKTDMAFPPWWREPRRRTGLR